MEETVIISTELWDIDEESQTENRKENDFLIMRNSTIHPWWREFLPDDVFKEFEEKTNNLTYLRRVWREWKQTVDEFNYEFVIKEC